MHSNYTMILLDDVDALIRHAREHGGFTASLETLQPLDLRNGYMVSSASGEARIDLDDAGEAAAFDVALALGDIRQLVNGMPGWYLGGWIDDDGHLCLDASERITGLERAIATGRARRQDAVYQLPTDRAAGAVLPL